MATHIFRGKDKDEAYRDLYAMVGQDVFIIREFTDAAGLYCIEAAPKITAASRSENAIPQTVATPNRPLVEPADRYTISQLLSQLRHAGFAEPTLRQFIYWMKRQNEQDPEVNKNQPKDIALQKFAEYLDIQKVIAPLAEAPQKPILLVGPPGSGKTVTTARLCARALMQGEDVDFVTLDCVRTGAVEQSRSLSKFLEINLAEIADVGQFINWMNKYNKDINQNITFIDSLSTNIYDMEDMRWLLDYMEAAEQNDMEIEPILVISATTDATTIGDYATTFKSMGINRVILTCWDIASKPAATFSALIDSGLQIAMISDSPYLTGGSEKLDAFSLAKKLAAKKGMPAWLEQIGQLK
ncbi:MAG: AAA family ATPase [OCS116 cluster bacterium]|uniref:SRP54-type proteins GTP-binding domain-containing protein n=1 Tax=OCS116 cluster bacterium TaxID=2030921 RepID=A0A2A4YPY1_9PROT|nr:AAA family ATPase [OCS116 cluster bacterium]